MVLVGEPDACRALSSCAEDAPPPMLMLRSRALCFESNWVASDSGIGDFGGGSYTYMAWPHASPPRSAEPPRAARGAPRRPGCQAVALCAFDHAEPPLPSRPARGRV